MNKKPILILIALTLIFANNALAEESDPKPASASLYNLGLKSYENGDTNAAISYFKRAAELDPNFIDAYFNLGAIYKKKRDYSNAVNAFRSAVAVDSSDEDAIYELASSYLLNKEYSNAQNYFTKLPKSYSKYEEVKDNLELIEDYLALEIEESIMKESNKKEISNKQANLLNNALAKSNPSANKQNFQLKEQNTVSHEHNLINSLTKPSSSNFEKKFRILSSNFSGPTGIVIDSKNNIYVANFIKNTIERITSTGKKELFLSKSGLNGPVGLTIDERDNLYVANYGGGSVIKISPNRKVTSVLTKIEKPYYLYYDRNSKSLFITSQGDNSLVEINTARVNQPISYK